MNRVDYERIAETYDDLPIRHEIPPEDLLPERREGESLRVLDVGCGTGLYLAAQSQRFADRNIEWFGIDPSDAMLARARARAPRARLEVGRAEAIPHDTASVDLVVCRFAFHHVGDKPRALDEFVRVLRAGGHVRITNIAPEEMPRWWIFTTFPEATAMNVRYPSAAWLEQALRARGLEVRSTLSRREGSIAVTEALRQARLRDQSHLASLDDDAYARGLSRLEALLATEPTGVIDTQSAVLDVVGEREGRGGR